MKNKLKEMFKILMLIFLVLLTIYNIIDTIWTINQQRIGAETVEKALDHYRKYNLEATNE